MTRNAKVQPKEFVEKTTADVDVLIDSGDTNVDVLPSFSHESDTIEIKMLRYSGNMSVGVDVFGRYWQGELKNSYAPQIVKKSQVSKFDVTEFESLLSRLNLEVGNGVEALLVEGVDPHSDTAVGDTYEAIRVRGLILSDKE